MIEGRFLGGSVKQSPAARSPIRMRVRSLGTAPATGNNLLMMDWYELRGGDTGNAYCKRYFDVALDEDGGAAFNTTTIDQDSSDDDVDAVYGGGGRKRTQSGKAKGGAKSKYEEALAGLRDAISVTGTGMAKAMEKMANNASPDPVDVMLHASKRCDEVEEQLQKAKSSGASSSKLRRLRKNVKAVELAYDQAERKVAEAQGGGAGGGGSDSSSGGDSNHPSGGDLSEDSGQD